jgi:hypothetical protein
MTRHCSHHGFHSGRARYRRETAQLRYVVVCDACLAEIREIDAIEYRPEFRPHTGRAPRRPATRRAAR